MFRNPATLIPLDNQIVLPSFSSERNHPFLNGNTSPFRTEEHIFYEQDDDFQFQNPSDAIPSFQPQFQNSFINTSHPFNQDPYILRVTPRKNSDLIMDGNNPYIQDFSIVSNHAKDSLQEEKLDDMLTLQVRESITTMASREEESNSEASSPQNHRRSQRNANGKRPEYNQQILTRQTGYLSDPSKQNLKKNFPVSIALRVRESSLKYLDFKYQGQETIITYLANLIQTKFPMHFDRRAYKEFLTEVKFSGKTYQAIKEQFQDYPDYLEIFMACIVGFLSDAGQEDFEDWLKGNRKMHDSNKQLLRRDKFQIAESFKEQLSLQQ